MMQELNYIRWCDYYVRDIRLLEENRMGTDEQKALFEKYTDRVRAHQTNTDCLIFQNSFKRGSQNDVRSHRRITEYIENRGMCLDYGTDTSWQLVGNLLPVIISYRIILKLFACLFSENLLYFYEIGCIILNEINTGELVCAGWEEVTELRPYNLMRIMPP